MDDERSTTTGVATQPQVAASLGDLRGAHLGPFVLQTRLGIGGIGEVWQAKHRRTHRPAAVKVLSPHVADDPETHAMFRQEVRAQARIDHPGVLRLLDLGTVPRGPEESPWIAMELARGGPLRLDAQGGWPAMVPIVRAVLEALAHVHAHGLVHRDLKPRNLLACLLSENSLRIKIGDFGVATLLERSDPSLCRPSAYLAPEQRSGRRVDVGPSTDLWALGAVIWEGLTGNPIRLGEASGAPLTEPLPAFAPIGECPAAVEPWLHTVLAASPEDRFACAADALRDLPEAEPSSRVWLREPPLPDVGLSLLALREGLPVGRDAEQAALQDALARTADGAQLVWLQGDDGSGRGHLGRWIALTAAIEGSTTIQASGRDADGWTRGLHRALRLEGASDDEVVERLRSLVSPAAPQSATDPETATQLAAWVSLLRPDHQATGIAPVRLTSHTRRAAVGAALVGALARPHHPAVVVLDDLQEEGTKALARLTLNQHRPVLVVATSAEPPPPELAAVAEVLTLDRLSEDAAEALVQAVIPLETEAARRVREAAGGLPGLTVELLRAWAEAGRLVPGDQGWRLAEGTLELPKHRVDAWETRLAEPLADATLGHALKVAARLGSEVREAEWRRALKLGEQPWPGDQLAELAGDVLTRHPNATWTWAHPVTRAAVERGLSSEERVTIEARCADAVAHDPSRRGQHLLAANLAEEALDSLLLAARLEEDQTGRPQRLGPLLALVEQALAKSHPPAEDPRRGWAAWLQAVVYVHRGDPAARATLEEALSAAETHGWHEVRNRVAIMLIRLRAEADDPSTAELADTVCGIDDARLRGLAHLERGLLRYDAGELEQAEADLQESLACLEPLLEPRVADVHHALASVYQDAGRFHEAAEANRFARVWHERNGSPWGAATARTRQGELYQLRGDPEAAEAAYREAARQLFALSSANAAIPLANLGALRLEAGKWERGYRLLMRAHDLCVQDGFADGNLARHLALAAGAAWGQGWAERSAKALLAAAQQATAISDKEAADRLTRLFDAVMSTIDPA